jgi:phospholipase/carboxylesterase
MLTTHFIPAAQPPSRRLMIVLHGLGDSLEGWLWLPAALQLPWLNFLLVNAPDPYYGGWSWFDIETGAGIAASRQLLFQLLDGLKEYPAGQIVFSGFSQGCLMSIEVGARYPRRLAGILGISGFVHEPLELIRELSPVAREQRFLITHGTEDPMIPVQLARKQVAYLKKAGLNIEWREFVKAHNVAGEEELAVIRQFVRECYEPADLSGAIPV